MKTLVKTSIIVIIFCISTSCRHETPKVDKKTFIDLTLSQEKILSASNSFGLDLFQDLVDSANASENIFISPLSVSLALTMTYNGAAGQTAIDMQKTLGYEGMSTNNINQSSKDLINSILNLDSKVVIEIANSIWYRNTFPIKSDFLSINKDYFNAEVQPADFNSQETVNLMNSWASNKTHDKINQIIAQIDPLAVMYLMNAIYFKGNWKYRFETKNTTKEPFHLTDGNTFSTDFMVQQDTFRYLSNNLLTVVELPYGDGGFSMVIMLPQTGKTYQDLIQNLNVGNWSQWNNQMNSANIQIHLPKFKFKYEKVLNKNLARLGMGIAFDDNRADFSGISNASQLFISMVLHKSFVEVNEEGTEAAAVTIVGISFTSIGNTPSYKIINVNKPFLFAIKENTANSLLFIGLVQKPLIE